MASVSTPGGRLAGVVRSLPKPLNGCAGASDPGGLVRMLHDVAMALESASVKAKLSGGKHSGKLSGGTHSGGTPSGRTVAKHPNAGGNPDTPLAGRAGREPSQELLEAIREHLGPRRFSLWFDEACRIVLEHEAVVIEGESRFNLDFVRRTLRGELEAAVATVCGPGTPVEFRLAESLPSVAPDVGTPAAAEEAPGAIPEGGSRQAPASRGPAKAKSRRAVSIDLAPQAPGAEVRRSTRPDGRLCRRRASLEAFVTGASNRMARAAAGMAVERPGEVSPLLVHGSSGVGKTHLLEGIATAFRERRPGLTTLMVSAEQFTTAFLQALHGGGLPAFRRSYRCVDVLLIDDLQFFIGKRATIVELHHTIDSLQRQGRQLVLAADREPAALAELGEEVAAVLEGGMTARIDTPDIEVRRGIVLGLAARRGLALDSAVVDYVAGHLTRNARELIGAINRLEASSHMLGMAVTPALAEEALADLVRASGRGVRLADIEQAICTAFGLEADSLKSSRRTRTVNHPRMLAMFLARKHTSAALAEIGSYFGRRSHSTVIAARKTVARWLDEQATVRFADASWTAEEALRRVEELLRAG